ncbi:ribonuclease H-like superfamily protein [Striga asiatica]|uniref:Ribonuclease H-like superfamily protein n=1 Tax=Striga asiatica TaxID=4170 RepID=A0A5A7PB85_STRAF|nr:ribonuclease H-like superfamily protein [Striga asiatica]
MILNIHLKPGQQDTMIWTPHKQGKFSVKSAYGSILLEKAAKSTSPESSNHNLIMSKVWKTTWGTQDKEEDTSLPLEMLVSLLRNSRSINQKRPKCRPNLQRLHWEGMQESNSSFRNWWSDICTMRKGRSFADRIHYSSYILWWLWKSRNIWIFNSTWKSEIDIAQGAWKEWTEFEEANYMHV